MRDHRVEGSHSYKPLYGNGSLVRVTNQEGFAEGNTADWGPIRLVFLNYGSDPIVAFTFDSSFRKPEWLGPERPFDVSPKLRWFPIVTMFQNALDMTLALKVERFGHYYVAPDYIDAWAETVAPEGWSEERAAELKAIFDKREPAF